MGGQADGWMGGKRKAKRNYWQKNKCIKKGNEARAIQISKMSLDPQGISGRLLVNTDDDGLKSHQGTPGIVK